VDAVEVLNGDMVFQINMAEIWEEQLELLISPLARLT